MQRDKKTFYALMILILLTPSGAYAGAFDGLISSGQEIFSGLREIIYPASAVGIIAVCIGGFFGNKSLERFEDWLANCGI